MLARARLLQARVLPHGLVDALRQVSLFAAAYLAYRLVRGLVEGDANAAFAHARDLIAIESKLHLFVEPSIQAWASGSHVVMVLASWLYINAQTTITLSALLYLYLRHNGSFYFVRNMFMIAMAIALVGYTVFPTAPPRFMPEWGFIDSVSDFTGVHVSHASASMTALFNPYAAVPSMHVAFALMVGWPLASLTKHGVVRVLWLLYPFLMAFVIVVTANHFIVDALLGALTAGASAYGARWLARARPAVWRFSATPQPCGRAGRRAAHDGSEAARLAAALARAAATGPGAPGRCVHAHRSAPGERRALMRDALIESRLTPNAISLTGLVLNVVAAALVWEKLFFLGGIAFIVGSIMDTLDGRYSRMSGKGTPFGAFLDSTLDRVEEGIVLTAVAAVLRPAWPAGRGGGGRRRGARVADGQLHACARRGARRRVQGRHRDAPGARRDPLDRPRLRARRLARELRAAAAGRLRARRPQPDHGRPAHLARAPRARRRGGALSVAV